MYLGCENVVRYAVPGLYILSISCVCVCVRARMLCACCLCRARRVLFVKLASRTIHLIPLRIAQDADSLMTWLQDDFVHKAEPFWQ